MSARVLIVDDIDVNVRLLEAKLAHEYYTVLTAFDGLSGLARARNEQPDVILLDAMMPGLDGFETCRRLKEDPLTRHIPVIMVTALTERENRLRGLEVGADDFLTKPVDDHQLFARLRSLTRHKLLVDELLQREAQGRAWGIFEGPSLRDAGTGARVLIVDDHDRNCDRMSRALAAEHLPFSLSEVENLGAAAGASLEIVIVSLGMRMLDPLKLIASLRGKDNSKFLPILAITDEGETDRARRALDLGASDIITRPVDLEELSARVRTLVKRKRFLAALRSRLDQGFELAVTDQLTGLHNRRYMINRVRSFLQRAAMGGETHALALFDLDQFKGINDRYGHDIGDLVLQVFARTMTGNIRPSDLLARIGGEEFVLFMPDTGLAEASEIAGRLRRIFAETPIIIPHGGVRFTASVSIGVSANLPGEETEQKLLKRADLALYEAKAGGRNRVVVYEETAAPLAPFVAELAAEPEPRAAHSLTA